MACGHDCVLDRYTRAGVTMVGSTIGAVSFGFTERTGGVSAPPFSSLNLGSHVGDDPAAVAENRRRALVCLGAEDCGENLLVPNQVHGDNVALVSDAGAETIDVVRKQIAAGADAVVCTVPNVPVMLCFADCVPVVLVCPGGFAVVHSGWRGTYARISSKAAVQLAAAAGCSVEQISAFIGPHILGDEYEVSHDLLQTFANQFDNIVRPGLNLLDLSQAIRQSLVEVGVVSCEIHDLRLSTVRLNERFYSYRREQGNCGRHAAMAIMR